MNTQYKLGRITSVIANPLYHLFHKVRSNSVFHFIPVAIYFVLNFSFLQTSFNQIALHCIQLLQW